MAAESEAESESGVDVIPVSALGEDLNWLEGGIIFGIGVGAGKGESVLILLEARGMHALYWRWGLVGWILPWGPTIQHR